MTLLFFYFFIYIQCVERIAFNSPIFVYFYICLYYCLYFIYLYLKKKNLFKNKNYNLFIILILHLQACLSTNYEKCFFFFSLEFFNYYSFVLNQEVFLKYFYKFYSWIFEMFLNLALQAICENFIFLKYNQVVFKCLAIFCK